MTLFTSFLFTFHIISSRVESLLSCPYQCQPGQVDPEKHCVKVKPLKGPVYYIPMFTCALREYKCFVGDAAILTSVEMSKCIPKKVTYPLREKREVTYPINIAVADEENSNSSRPLLFNALCPNKCPTSSDMVCARCNHHIYRSFLSGCHMRMYQCRHPEERLELVSRHSCYGSAPYMDGNRPQDVENALHDVDAQKGAIKLNNVALSGVLHESYFWPAPHPTLRTPKPTVHVTWPSRRTRTKSDTPLSKPRTKRPTTPKRTTPTTSSTTSSTKTTTTTQATSTTTDSPQSNEDNDDVERIDVDICPNDEDQETAIIVPDVCTNTSNKPIFSSDYMKVDLHPDFIEDGSPVWMVFNGGTKITSKLRADAGIVVGCNAYAGLDFSGNVVARNKADNDFIGLVFGYRSNSQFYLVSWKAKSDKYWIGWPSIVKADAGIHIKLVNSTTGPGAYLRNALYSTESVKDQVKLLWQDPKKQGWKHLLIYSWELIHRPHIGLIRVKVFRGGKLIVDSGNVYDKTIKGGRIGVYAFSQENIEWHKMKFECNDKIPRNLMSELPPDLQKISVVDSDYTWNNKSWP
ncbi:uncharacterized protein LOC133527693 isoform X2 [Cydia pomonella]|uniref:uncharacterized protein LOC133527693 isoform X2 n=1 Tax=Cydia pomonella TaxID=82600 RepID=UPI002ADD8DFC|nr:uncharacterized protein LOC133527693 isoform X2 [Cydia pomonella]